MRRLLTGTARNASGHAQAIITWTYAPTTVPAYSAAPNSRPAELRHDRGAPVVDGHDLVARGQHARGQRARQRLCDHRGPRAAAERPRLLADRLERGLAHLEHQRPVRPKLRRWRGAGRRRAAVALRSSDPVWDVAGSARLPKP